MRWNERIDTDRDRQTGRNRPLETVLRIRDKDILQGERDRENRRKT